MEMDKSYKPQEFEAKLYKWWEESGFFKPEPDHTKPKYSMSMPPPNITAQLHVGHALNSDLSDAIIRFKRMQGYNVLWVPGIDHASIATEVKIVERLAEQNITKAALGREKFLEKCFEWKEQYGGRIIEQQKKLGCSADWEHTAFTMDERCGNAVRYAFVTLYKKGLIYQGSKIINWCPCCKTALSDAEVEYEEQASHLWQFKYITVDGADSITFATTRPETMLGDTAVAVNPTDKRYAHLIGKQVTVPFVDRIIPIIADNYVEKDFGTGVVKITPAHDPNDFEVGLRHNLPVIRVMNDDGTMNQLAGKYSGLTREQCRIDITKDMEQLGQLVKIEDYKHNVGSCYRCHSTVEPIISKQWFVKMKPLAQPAIDVVKSGQVKYYPKRFEKTYFNWMENIRDWCISRQLWWGHRIPVWYCKDCGEVICEESEPKCCPKCSSTNLRQDEDVLDTWFSSALWPFSTLGYPERTPDYEYFYPTDILVTMYDIIFFWVARMIFSGLEYTGKIPFSTVLIHGMVRDNEGHKMSKSAGNGVDPVEFIDSFGADTLRFSLLSGVASGNDMRFKPDKVENTANFMNKIWNASRFVLLNCEGKEILPIEKCKLNSADKWLLTKLNAVCRSVNKNNEKYEFGLSTATLYDFIWSEFCDWYIEFSKPILYGTDESAKQYNLSVLVYVLDKILKLMHPFAPFITEQIYQQLPNHQLTIMKEQYPTATGKNYYSQHNHIEQVKQTVTRIRNARAEVKVPPSKRITAHVNCSKKLPKEVVIYIEKLANCIIDYTPCTDSSVVKLLCPIGEIILPLGEMVDIDKEIARLNTEIEKITAEIELCSGKLNNPNFVSRAPAALVEKERGKLVTFNQTLQQLQQQIATLQNK